MSVAPSVSTLKGTIGEPVGLVGSTILNLSAESVKSADWPSLENCMPANLGSASVPATNCKFQVALVVIWPCTLDIVVVKESTASAIAVVGFPLESVVNREVSKFIIFPDSTVSLSESASILVSSDSNAWDPARTEITKSESTWTLPENKLNYVCIYFYVIIK